MRKDKSGELYRFDLEHVKGNELIAGVDEAGRGPLAGPVVASAVILDLSKPIKGINDSKQLSESQRESLFKIIQKEAIAYGVSVVDHNVIDDVNILNATKRAMFESIASLLPQPDCVLIDAVFLADLGIPQYPIKKGDCLSASIAAASVLAKVTRDRLMIEYNHQYPSYFFAQHKGYPTKLHVQMLNQFGPCPIHRKSFSPVRNAIEARKS